MERHLYLILSSIYVTLWIVIFLSRSDLKKKLLFTGLTGGIAGLISEFWYVKDYWQPPTILGTAVSVEDFLFGFGVAGVGSVLYQIFYRQADVQYEKQRFYALPIISVITLIALLIFNDLLDVNSILVSSGVFVVIFAMFAVVRKDLIVPSLLNGLLLTLVSILIYSFWLLLSTGFAEKYWLLQGTWLDIKFIGIPLTEVLWFFTFGIAAGGLYEFLWGFKFSEKANSAQK